MTDSVPLRDQIAAVKRETRSAAMASRPIPEQPGHRRGQKRLRPLFAGHRAEMLRLNRESSRVDNEAPE